ncbi:MAG: hypothetical protein AAF242_04155 [Bacteroidota bacterium]
MSQVKNTIKSLREFNQWMSRGGESRAGLPNGTLRTLDNEIRSYRVEITEFHLRLRRIRDFWVKMTDARKSNPVAKVFAQKFLSDLKEIDPMGETMVQDAADIGIEAVRKQDLVNRHLKEDASQLSQAEIQLQQSRMMLMLARVQKQRAEEELNGSKGFLNGFLTGITFGIHNPLKTNLDRRTNAVNTINRQIHQQQELVQRIKEQKAELEQSSSVFNKLDDLDAIMVNCKNLISNIDREMEEAIDHEERVQNTGNQRVADIYRSKTKDTMRELTIWHDQMSAAL